MKRCFLLVSCILQALAYYDQNSLQYKQSRPDCLAMLGVKVNKNGNPVDKEDPKLKCLKRCMLLEIGTILESGDPNFSQFNQTFLTIAKLCDIIAKQFIDNECRRANRFDKCMRNNAANNATIESQTNCTVDGAKMDLQNEADFCNIRCYMLQTRFVNDKGELTEELFEDDTNKDQNKRLLMRCNGLFGEEDLCPKTVHRYICALQFSGEDY